MYVISNNNKIAYRNLTECPHSNGILPPKNGLDPSSNRSNDAVSLEPSATSAVALAGTGVDILFMNAIASSALIVERNQQQKG